jgi:hypothetical protein
MSNDLCGPLRPSASSALNRRFNAENTEIRRGRQRRLLKITAAFRVSTIAIEFDRVARAFALCATVFATRLRGTGTRGVFTLVLVSHEVLLKLQIVMGTPRVAH